MKTAAACGNHAVVCIAALLVVAVVCGGCGRQHPSAGPETMAGPDATTQSPVTAAPETAPRGFTGESPDASSDISADADSAAAVNVINDYYAAINERDYRRAYEHWGQDGVASGKSFEEFAAGFSDTAKLTVTTGTAGRVDPAAGSRYITIPVVVTAVTRQGQEQRFEGTYDLRRTIVDGATEAQRRWHFYRAALTQTR